MVKLEFEIGLTPCLLSSHYLWFCYLQWSRNAAKAMFRLRMKSLIRTFICFSFICIFIIFHYENIQNVNGLQWLLGYLIWTLSSYASSAERQWSNELYLRPSITKQRWILVWGLGFPWDSLHLSKTLTLFQTLV